MATGNLIGSVPVSDDQSLHQARRAAARERATSQPPAAAAAVAGLPDSKMPKSGYRRPRNLRGPAGVTPPAHRASSKVLGGAYPFLAETGDILTGAYIGENMLSRAPFCFDPWDAYAAGVIRSHSCALIGVKGSGKSYLAKSWASRLVRLGRKVAVPHDPNGEWARVAAYVGGKSISVGRGKCDRINPLDPGPRDPDVDHQTWRMIILQYRRATIRAIVSRLRDGTPFTPVEHTALDIVLESLAGQSEVLIPHVLDRLTSPDKKMPADVGAACQGLAHTLRRVVHGDLAGMFDGPSTVAFDSDAVMMVVDTSAMKGASPEAQALSRLATANWVRRSSLGGNRQARVIVHEEAAVELLNEVAAGDGLAGRVEDEKIARHLGTSNWYLLHRIADLDALGDLDSALHAQALGLLADCDTRISYAQQSGEIQRSRQVLGWNDTQALMVRKLRRGEGLWQIGPDRLAKVKNICTDGEHAVFKTDALAGERP